MSKPYTMTMRLRRGRTEDAERRALDVALYDRMLIDEEAFGSAFLNLDEVVPGTDLRVRALRDVFFRGNGGSPEDGLHLGKYLLEKLVADASVGRLWGAARDRRSAQQRPLRLELVMDAEELAELGELPFELLADRNGFLFRRDGYVLVRAPRGLEVRTAEIKPGDGVLVAWAQPKNVPHVEDVVFAAHEKAVAEGARSAQLSVREPCRHASLRDLELRLLESGGVKVVSLVAHGDELGGTVMLHMHDHPERPDDPGEPVGGTDLARVLRRGDVAVALLWVCHSAHRNEAFGDLATKLLHPEHGDLAAVVASSAALRAKDAARVARRILEELRGGTGDLERAVSAARGALAETDLQWAAPAYYARPSDGRTVTMAKRLDSLGAAPAFGGMTLEEVLALPAMPFGGVESFTVTLERAPEPWPHFRGRESEIDDGLKRLRAGRLVSLTGMPGTGKTELGLAIAQRALDDEKLAPERAVWLALDGVTSAASVVATLASWAGVTIDDKREVTAADVARALGNKPCLVVLDNAEDPIRADRAAMRADLDTLLAGAPGLRLLLASRDPIGDLRSANEQALRVGPLDPGPAREAFLSAAGDRLTAGERASPELDRLLAWADGHPLSLMLLAKQLGEVSLRGLLRRIDTHGAEAVVDAGLFGEDTAETPDEKLRRERLVSSLNLSYAPLAAQHPSAAEMFAWLGLFPAGLVGALLEPVFGPTAEDDRATLVRKSLADVVGPEQRLILPAPVRDYARKKLEGLPKEKRWERFAAAMRAEGQWLDGLYKRTSKPAAREALDAAKREAPNVEALVDALSKMDLPAYRAKEATELSLALGLMLWPHLIIAARDHRGRFVETSGRAGAALAERLDAVGTALIDHGLGDVLVQSNQLTDAERSYLNALHVNRRHGMLLGEANTLKALAELFALTGRLDDAEKSNQEALAIYHKIDDRRGQANVLGGIGTLLILRGEPRAGFVPILRALELHRELEDAIGDAADHLSLGLAAFMAKSPHRAAVSASIAFRAFTGLNATSGRAEALGLLTFALNALDRNVAAARTLFRATTALLDNNPRLAQLALSAGIPAGLPPPSIEEVAAAQTTLDTALTEVEAEFAATGEDLYAPLPPPEPSPEENQ